MPRKKILWLCSWYPGRVEPFNGDFIQRHAEAAALFNDIYVIHIYGDSTGRFTRTTEEIRQFPHLAEHLVYFPKKRGWIGRVRGAYKWLSLFRRTIRSYVRAYGKPDLVHVNIPMKAGLFGMWMKKKYSIPYVLTEHWGIYSERAPDNFLKRGKTFQQYTRRILREAAVFTSVSNFLGENVNRLVLKKEWRVIPNVVNTGLFHYTPLPVSTVFRFIHVSNMIPLKNPEGILKAFRQLVELRQDVELVMIGDRNPDLKTLAQGLGLGGKVSFTGEIPYADVASQMKQSHCVILFSNIENSPCVIGESLCCGVPVIATRVGGIPELITDANGILVEPGNEEALKEAMVQMIEGYKSFDRREIASAAERKFSYPVIGKLFNEVYTGVK